MLARRTCTTTALGALLHGKETRRRYRYRGAVDVVERRKNRTKSAVRAKVEHISG